MSVKDLVFSKINLHNGDVDVKELTDDIFSKFPNSQWDNTHWSYYRTQIISEKGRFSHLFSDEIKTNLKNMSSKRFAISSSTKKIKSKTPIINHNFKFEDKTKHFEIDIAKILAKTSYHIHPKIVEIIIKDNIDFKEEFERIAHRNLKIADYFFEGSDCLFPGTRRNISKEKVGKWKNNIYDLDGSILNDNTFPRHLWTFLCCNKSYSSNSWKDSGLNAFELAHIFSHKTDERKFDASCFENFNLDINPYSLFTSASNIVIIPKGLTKPTDKSEIIKIVFFKRYFDLYKHITQLPALSDFKEHLVPEWYHDIVWNEPFLPIDWEFRIQNLLIYRKKSILNKYRIAD